MFSESELMFQLGAIMLLAFIAATMARKLNQTVMIGYIIIGIIIGPKISINIFGANYHGLIGDTTFIDMLSSMGLIMLMFFVGLEFSFTKLKKTRTPAIILAVIDTSVGLFVGFMFASYLGWPLIDSIFLAGVVAMSSTSIAMKVLFDLKRMSSPEVEFLIGLVVVETFIAMVILAVASGMIVQPDADPMNYGRLLIGLVAFYAFFVWLAMWAVPRIVSFFDKIENDELFILFALGIVFLTAGLASVMNVPPIIGAFFIGMILAESKVTIRVQAKLESFRDAFVAIFFTAFGMMIDPAMFSSVIWMLAIAIPAVVIYEALVMSGISYFLGFSSRASTTIGTSMCGRGVESILYASVGSQVKGATMGAQLNPFAGAFCFIMSAITPPLVKHSARFANVLSGMIPRPLKFSGAIVSRTFGKAVLPSNIKSLKGARTTGVILLAFVVACFATLATKSYMAALGLTLAIAMLASLRTEVSEIVRMVNYTNIGVGVAERKPIVDLVTGVAFGAVASALTIAFAWQYMWQLSAVTVVCYVLSVAALMFWAYRRLHSEGFEVPPTSYRLSGPVQVSSSQEDDDLLPEVPKPVYGIAQAAQNEVRL
jgi:CPA2 family monovalent cation:H+ antiporter-2